MSSKEGGEKQFLLLFNSLVFRFSILNVTEYATGYYTDQEKKCLGIQPDLTQNAVGSGGVAGSANSSAYCEYTYSEPTTSGTSGSKSGALTPVIVCFILLVFL